MSKVTIFRKMKGVMQSFKIDDLAMSQIRYGNSKVQGAKGAQALWKKFRTDPMTRMTLWRPGGAYDPKELAKDALAYENHRIKSLAEDIKKAYGSSDDIAKQRGKNAAKQATDFVEMMNGVFGKSAADLKAKVESTQHLTRAQMYKEATKPFSKKKFIDAVHMDETISSQLKSNIKDAATELYEPYGGSGKSFLKSALKQRKMDAIRVQKQVESQMLPKKSDLHRRINLRAKGVVFRRIGGRIVPIRVKG